MSAKAAIVFFIGLLASAPAFAVPDTASEIHRGYIASNDCAASAVMDSRKMADCIRAKAFGSDAFDAGLSDEQLVAGTPILAGARPGYVAKLKKWTGPAK